MNLKSVLLYIASYFVFVVDSKRADKQLYCAVCRALVDEIKWSISQVDPKKTIQVGSFRVDTNGNQAISEKPYARSETHLTELMEGICHKMDDYLQTTDASGRTSVVRTTSRTGKALSLKNLSTDKESKKTIKFYCESIIEDHEEDMIGLFKREFLPEIEKAICGDIVSACTGDHLNIPLPTAAAEEEGENLIQDVEGDDDTEEDDDNLSELDKEEL
ncbi:hypothetical protein SNE40_012096 [Patella caerulea]|uniref:DUF3456 domain-containing protein n=1 Tax=Patella caerulea TaxID=87958 RepID=A0AAN8JQS9_PATCE